MFAVQEVSCVDGCGGGTLPIVIGLVVASLSATLSGLAVWDARRSRQAAERSLRIAQEQHAVFLAQQAARVDFNVELSLTQPPPDRCTLRAASGVVTVRVRFRVQNVGSRAAEPRVNLLYPAAYADHTHDRWTTENGALVAPASAMSSDEDLLVAGEPVETVTAYREWPRLSPGGDVLVGFFQVNVGFSEGWSRVEIPFSIRVWSDPMPEGIEDRRDDLVVTLRYDPSAPS